MGANWHIFKALLARDARVMQQTLIPDGVDALILIFLQYVNFVYFLPLMGMDSVLIAPLFVGSIGSVFINTAFDRAIADSADVAFTHFVQYQMTLPLSLTWLFAQKMVTHVMSIAIYSVPALLVLLWYTYTTITFIGFLLFLVIYSMSLVWVAALVIAIAYGTHFFWFIDNVWTRILMPIAFLGCTFFSWKAAYSFNHWLGLLYGLSPLTYTVEGLRSAIIGGPEYISVYLCLSVLTFFLVSMVYIARTLFVRRLYA